jgi:hypothetical protein
MLNISSLAVAVCLARLHSVPVPSPSAPHLALCLFRDFDTIVNGRRIAEQLTELSAFQAHEAGANLEAGGSAETRGLLRLSAPPQRVLSAEAGTNRILLSARDREATHVSGFVVVYREAELQLQASVNFGDLCARI